MQRQSLKYVQSCGDPMMCSWLFVVLPSSACCVQFPDSTQTPPLKFPDCRGRSGVLKNCAMLGDRGANICSLGFVWVLLWFLSIFATNQLSFFSAAWLNLVSFTWGGTEEVQDLYWEEAAVLSIIKSITPKLFLGCVLVRQALERDMFPGCASQTSASPFGACGNIWKGSEPQTKLAAIVLWNKHQSSIDCENEGNSN